LTALAYSEQSKGARQCKKVPILFKKAKPQFARKKKFKILTITHKATHEVLMNSSGA